MQQQYSSAQTSINVKPATVWRKLNYAYLRARPFYTIIDYGCGKYWENTKQYCANEEVSYLPYDPYWINNDINMNTLGHLKHSDTVCVCANVLNVIQENEIMKCIIKEITSSAREWIFQIYEGNKTGIGGKSKKDCYQRNQKTKEYVKILQELGIPCYYYKNYIFSNLNLYIKN